MNKKVLLSSGAVMLAWLALPCAAATLPSVAAPTQAAALPAVTTATAAMPVLPATSASSSMDANRVASRTQALPGLDGLDSGSKPAATRVLSIRPIRVPPDVLPTPPIPLPQ